MKNIKCNHKNFWEIYKLINFNRVFSDKDWRKFKCSNCWKKCVMKWKWYKKMKKSYIKSMFTYFLWLFPAIILIYLTAIFVINYLCAILLIIFYHLGAMYYIINSDRLKINEK